MSPRCLLLLMLLPLQGMAAEQAANPAPIFQHHEPLTLRLEAPFTRILNSRGEDAEYFPGNFFYSIAEGEEITAPLRIKTRGNNRNEESVCRFPPLMLNFAKREVGATVFAGEDKLKLVTHCQPYNQYHQYVLLEYLSYRILNLLTDYSLRVRLLDISYFNDAIGKPVISARGFLIEDIERFGKRMGMKELQQKRLERYWYDQEQETLAALFLYMIGSTDWSLVVGTPGEACCHNIIPMQAEGEALMPLPYDFDVSGIVNPRYGFPARQLGQHKLTDRLYRGACPRPEILAQTVGLFVEKRADINMLFEQQEGLSKAARERALKYIDEFYALITDDAQVQNTILGDCI